MEFSIYKRGQGYHTRLWSGLVSFAVVAIGSYILWRKMQVYDNEWVKVLVPGAVCAFFTFLIYWIVNKPAVADCMIAAEGEVKKVSWSSRKEIITSTIVVIWVVLGMAFLLWVTDMTFQLIFRYVIKIY